MKHSKLIAIISAIIISLIVGGVVYEKKITATKHEQHSFNLLVMGVDERKEDAGRSDVLMLVNLNTKTNKAKVMPIPRDTRVKIAGINKTEKINHAYKYGGISMTLNTVEDFLHIPVDYYVKVNMEGFKAVVNELGSVEVDNPFPFMFGSYLFPKGHNTLDGDRALAYVRMRHEDPKGDLGRNERQRQVMESLLEKGMDMSTINNIPELLNIAKNHIKTNVTLKDAFALYNVVKQGKPKFETVHVEGEPQVVDGTWYYIVDEQQKEHISAMFQQKSHTEKH
ncbi:LytR family transcriptional regulator [Priestia megaterium]|nr:LytR family transcriptional regulator [Priestia megaterium]